MALRRRSRGMVTPPVDALEDSDSDTDVSLLIDCHQNDTEQCTHSMSANKHFPKYGAPHPRSRERERPHFDSGELDLDEEKLTLDRDKETKTKDQANSETLRIERFLRSVEKGQHTQGMMLRSGSQIKGVERFLHSARTGHRHLSHVTSPATGDVSNNAHQSEQSPILPSWRQSSHNLHDSRHSSTHVSTTTTATFGMRDRRRNSMNSNNNARRARRKSKSPSDKPRAGRLGKARWSDSYYEELPDNDDSQPGGQFRLKYMYDLDQSDDYSDSDSYSYTSSFTSADCNSASSRSRRRAGYANRSAEMVLRGVTKTADVLFCAVKRVSEPFQKLLSPVCRPTTILLQWLWKYVNGIIGWFIVLDSWVVSRNSKRNCCLCLPLLLLPLLLATGSYYSYTGSVIFPTYRSFLPQQLGDKMQSTNLHYEVRQILRQLQAENYDVMTRSEIETLVRNTLNPEMEALKVSLLNMAKEGNSDQTVLKVNQNDARQRLLALEEQMAALSAKAKILDGDMSDTKNLFIGTLNGDRDKQSETIASVSASVADLKAKIESLQSAYNNLVDYSKTSCIDKPSLMVTVQEQVGQKLAEILGEESKDQGAGGSGFTDWLSKKYVDHNELDVQLRLLTEDLTDRIKRDLRGQSSGGSSFLLSSGSGSINEDTVRLIVEDALLKYSADRTGMPDYALESAGGSVLNERCSETYVKKTAVLSVFGIPLFYMSSSPRSVIQPEVHPGQCWAFKGDKGHVVIQLAVPIRPTGFSVEHIPRSLSIHGNIDSAPKDFTVIGLKSDADYTGLNLGNFTYQSMGTPIQHFSVQLRSPGVFNFVELRVLNNHGNKDYTCLYRFRVHGVPQS